MDKVISVFISLAVGVTQFLYGEWPPPPTLIILAVLVCIDYTSGVAAGALAGEIKSKVGMIGIARKIFIFLIVAVAHLIDVLLMHAGMETKALIMNMGIVFYCVNEIISITENAGKIGLPVPEQIRNAIVVLKGKDDRNISK